MGWKTAAKLGVSLWLALGAARADCVTSLRSSENPITSGHVAFQRVVGENESYVYVYDVANQLLVADSSAWRDVLYDAHNPSLSRDGRWIVFMARPKARVLKPMRIWAWNPSLPAPLDLTKMSGGNTGLYDEDPKFAPDDRHIVFKRDGSIVIMSVGGLARHIHLGAVATLAHGTRGGSDEASGPVLSADNTHVFFFRHPRGSESLERLTLDDQFQVVEDLPYENPQDTESYYPALRRDGTLYFARHSVDSAKQIFGHDSIYVVAPGQDVAGAVKAPVNLCDAVAEDVENADPAAAGAGLVIFSSTFHGGRYQLYVGNGRGGVWSFADINGAMTTGALQAASYVPR